MASLTRWTWVWVNSRSWWWTGRPGMLRFMGSQRVGHDWVTELKCLNWTDDPFQVSACVKCQCSFFNRFLVFPAFCWKKIILSPLNYLTFLSKNNWPYIHISGFSIPFNCSIYLSHAKMTVYLLQLYGSLEIRLYKSFSFVLCQDCFS